MSDSYYVDDQMPHPWKGHNLVFRGCLVRHRCLLLDRFIPIGQFVVTTRVKTSIDRTIIESSKGIINAYEIATSSDAIIALTIGLEDYTADLCVKRTFDGSESFYARSHLVTVCKAAGIQAIDSVFSDVGDTDGLRQTSKNSKALGFEGMGCIHPRQIAVINECFAPDSEEIEKAKKIIKAFDEATRKGLGVVSLGTKMIDPPVVERARHVLDQAILLAKISKDWRSVSE